MLFKKVENINLKNKIITIKSSAEGLNSGQIWAGKIIKVFESRPRGDIKSEKPKRERRK